MATAPVDDRPALLTIPEAAQLLRLSVSQVYALAQGGQLPVIRIGRSVRIHRGKLERWIDQQG